jgi:hypothetical protein
MSRDVNSIMRAYLAAQAGLTAVVSTRIYCPRLPEKASLPALAFFVRGGSSTAYIPPIVDPSFQFDCWGNSPIEARSVYTALYDVLQGIENQSVAVGGDTYRILSAVEEVQGQDIQDVENPGYHRVMTFFKVVIQILAS